MPAQKGQGVVFGTVGAGIVEMPLSTVRRRMHANACCDARARPYVPKKAVNWRPKGRGRRHGNLWRPWLKPQLRPFQPGCMRAARARRRQAQMCGQMSQWSHGEKAEADGSIFALHLARPHACCAARGMALACVEPRALKPKLLPSTTRTLSGMQELNPMSRVVNGGREVTPEASSAAGRAPSWVSWRADAALQRASAQKSASRLRGGIAQGF